MADLPTPDDFLDAMRQDTMLMLSRNPKTGAALSLAEGEKLAQDLALAATNIYRRFIRFDERED